MEIIIGQSICDDTRVHGSLTIDTPNGYTLDVAKEIEKLRVAIGILATLMGVLMVCLLGMG
jgi:hypothetical protein